MNTSASKAQCIVLAAAALALTASPLRSQQFPLFPQAAMSGSLSDVTGDGLPDLVVLTGPFSQGIGVYVRAGHGNGTFDPPPANEMTLWDRLVGDVTGDGVVDVVRTGSALPVSFDGGLSVYPGVAGGFGPAVETKLPPLLADDFAQEPLLADMNDDGRLDWVATCLADFQSSQFTLDIGTSVGTASFSLTEHLVLDGYFSAFAVDDFDADGVLDTVVADSSGVAVYVRKGQGDGTLAPTPVATALPIGAMFSPRLASGDVDDDGYIDLVLSAIELSGLGGAVDVLRGNGSASFTPTAIIPDEVSGTPAVGDLNGDGLPDVVIAHGTWYPDPPAGTAVYFNDGAGGLVAGPASDAATADSPELADINGDGLLDLYVHDFLHSFFLSGQGDGSFLGRTTIQLQGDKARSIEAVDMNVDGIVDLVSTMITNQQGLAVALADGSGNFTVHYAVVDKANRLACGDLNGDAAADVIVTTGGATKGALDLLNDGSGKQFSAPSTALTFAASDIGLGDFDGDGILDLIAARAPTKDLVLRRGDGAGGWLPVENIVIGGAAFEVAIDDIDVDGHLDIATTMFDEPELAVAAGHGDGTFGAPQPVILPGEARPILIADVDGNSLPDIAAGSIGFEQDYEVFVVLSQAAGVLGAPQIIETQNVPLDLRAGDIDRDNKVDLVVLTPGSADVFRGLGAGSFGSREEYVVGEDLRSFALGDFTGDERLDIAAASSAHHSIEILPNLTTDFPNLGYQHPTTAGTPHLVATGAPVPDELVTFTATNAPAGALGFLILGLEFAPTPFHGGTLVPSPDLAMPIRPGVPLTGRWPALLTGTAVYAQAWFATGGEFAATNSVLAMSH